MAFFVKLELQSLSLFLSNRIFLAHTVRLTKGYFPENKKY